MRWTRTTLGDELFERRPRLADALPSRRAQPAQGGRRARRWSSPPQDAELKAALFRFVDVVPGLPLARRPRAPPDRLPRRGRGAAAAGRRRACGWATRRAGRTALGAAAAAGVKHMAHRFIVGESPQAALGTLRELWKDGVASSVDLLGEATVTQAEAQRYAERCDGGARRRSPRPRASWPERPALERDARRARSRARTCPSRSRRSRRCCAPTRPSAASATPPTGCAGCCAARATSTPTCTSTWSRWTRATRCSSWCSSCSPRTSSAPARRPAWCCRPTCATRRRRSTRCSTGPRARAPARAHPLTVRLVKGAYWDHEIVEAAPARLDRAGVRGQGRLATATSRR